MAVLDAVQEEGLDEDLIALVKFASGDLAGAAEIGLGLHHEVLRVALGHHFVPLLGEFKDQLAEFALFLLFFGQNVGLLRQGLLRFPQIEFFVVHDSISFL